jgi:hypothetical protein
MHGVPIASSGQRSSGSSMSAMPQIKEKAREEFAAWSLTPRLFRSAYNFAVRR